MEAIEFREQTVILAKNQPEYLPLPVHQFQDDEGRIAFCWKLTMWERLKVLLTGIIWQQVFTFNKPLQPQKLQTRKPKMNQGKPPVREGDDG